MSAPARLLADALLPIVSSFPILPALAPVRKYLPQLDLKTLAGRQCLIVPRKDESTSKADRGNRWNHELMVDVALLEKLDDELNATADVLLDLADDLCEYLKANRPARPEKLMFATVQVLWDVAALKTDNVFSTAVTLTFAAIR